MNLLAQLEQVLWPIEYLGQGRAIFSLNHIGEKYEISFC